MAIVKKISELTPKGSALANTDLLIVGVDNGTDYDLKSITGAQLLGNVVSQTITDGVTTKAPSEDVVFDTLALKVDKVTGSRLITSAESTILGNTSGTNTGDETVTTIKTKLGISTLSGSNTGDQDLSGYQPYTTETTASVISFVVPQVYNTVAGPSTSNIIDSLTNAKIGIVQKIYHNHTVAPTFPAGWVKMGTGTYTTSTLNVIFAEWVSSTRVEYWITKPS